MKYDVFGESGEKFGEIESLLDLDGKVVKLKKRFDSTEFVETMTGTDLVEVIADLANNGCTIDLRAKGQFWSPISQGVIGSNDAIQCVYNMKMHARHHKDCKILLIKFVRTWTSWDLKKSKDFVEALMYSVQ